MRHLKGYGTVTFKVHIKGVRQCLAGAVSPDYAFRPHGADCPAQGVPVQTRLGAEVRQAWMDLYPVVSQSDGYVLLGGRQGGPKGEYLPRVDPFLPTLATR